jgi:predicted methyltransferase
VKAAVWEDSSLSLLRGVLYEEKTELLRGQGMVFHRVAERGQRTTEKDCRRRE